MSKQSSQSPISLNSVFNGVVSSIFDQYPVYTITKENSPYKYSYNDYVNYSWETISSYTSPIIVSPSYPVNNYGIDENLNSIIEIAVSGFSEEDIIISREDLKLIVEVKKELQEEKIKYFYRNIARRKFKLEFEGSDKWNFEKLEASLKNGILRIVIPMKEEFKPVKQTFKIK